MTEATPCKVGDGVATGNGRIDHFRRSVKLAGRIGIGVVLLGLVIVPFTPASEYLRNPQQLRNLLDHNAHIGLPILLLLSLVFQIAGASRLVLTGVLAWLAGFWWGLLGVLATTLLSAGFIFELAKWLDLPVPERLTSALREYGVHGPSNRILLVFLIRQLPLPGVVINIGLGCLKVSNRAFWVGSLLGFLPLAVPAAFVGAGLAAENTGHRVMVACLGVTLLIALVAVLRVVRSKMKRHDP